MSEDALTGRSLSPASHDDDDDDAGAEAPNLGDLTPTNREGATANGTAVFSANVSGTHRSVSETPSRPGSPGDPILPGGVRPNQQQEQQRVRPKQSPQPQQQRKQPPPSRPNKQPPAKSGNHSAQRKKYTHPNEPFVPVDANAKVPTTTTTTTSAARPTSASGMSARPTSSPGFRADGQPRIPKIVAEEKELRDRAAQELLRFAPIADDTSAAAGVGANQDPTSAKHHVTMTVDSVVVVDHDVLPDAALSAAAAAASRSTGTPPQGFGDGAINPLSGRGASQIHGRGESVEYFVKTEHGASRASVMFDSQQECMTLSTSLEPHHLGHIRVSSLGRGAVAPAATGAGAGVSPGSVGSGGMLLPNRLEPRDLMTATRLPHTASPHDIGPATSGGVLTDEGFTPEQLAAIAAFDDQNRIQTVDGTPALVVHPRTTSLTFYQRARPGAENIVPESTSRPASPPANRRPSAARTTNVAAAAATASAATVSSFATAAPAASAALSGTLASGDVTAFSSPQSHATPAGKQPQVPTGPVRGASRMKETPESAESLTRRSSLQQLGQSPKAAAGVTLEDQEMARVAGAGTEDQQHGGSVNLDGNNNNNDMGDNNILYAGFGPRKNLQIPPCPYDTPFKQNTQPSIRFQANTWWIVGMMIVVATTCLPLGSVLTAAADSAARVDVRYDHINTYRHPASFNFSETAGSPGNYLWSTDIAGIRHRQGQRAILRFNLTEKLEAPILMSYGLTNFFYNHLNVQQSKSWVQTAGKLLASSLDTANCNPILQPGDLKTTVAEKSTAGLTTVDLNGVPFKQYRDFNYCPCGSVPWSMFNDSFVLWRVSDDAALPLPAEETANHNATNPNNIHLTALNTSVAGVKLFCNSSDFSADGTQRFLYTATSNPCTKDSISIASDKARIKEPNFDNNGGVLWTNTVHRHFNTTNVYLANGWYADEPGHEVPNMFNLDFHVWMRVPPVSTFRKLLRVIEVDMPAGQYQLEVDEYFDSTSFKGQKFLSLETRTAFGGRNFLLPILYLITGSLALVILVATMVQWMFESKAQA